MGLADTGASPVSASRTFSAASRIERIRWARLQCTLTRMPVRVRSHVRRRTVAAAVAAGALLAAGCSTGTDDAVNTIRTTTNIAGAGVIGTDRDTRGLCADPTAPDAASGSTRSITHTAGVTTVPADPQRIVVLDTQALDATCAVGLWERVVGAATLDGPRAQPRYLGYGIKKVPGVGPLTAPDPEKIKELHPDLIIGAAPVGAATWPTLSAIAPTVFTGTGGGWQHVFATTAQAMGRDQAAKLALLGYQTKARDVGVAQSAPQTQASLLRFTADRIEVQGTDSFAGQVLTDVGARRPKEQRGESSPLDPSDIDKAEGDLIYIDLAGEDGSAYGEKIMRGDAWRDLSAYKDHRVFVVDDYVWNGNGITAARTLLDDLDKTLNGYGT